MKPYVLTYPEAKSLVICGDIHGDFVPLVYEMCVRYGMRDTLVIVAGDCGFGFEKQRQNAAKIADMGYETIKSENGFMVIIRTNDVAAAKADFAKRGIETETHFARCIDWATEFGYKAGTCPMAEKLTKQLLMIPTYKR